MLDMFDLGLDADEIHPNYEPLRQNSKTWNPSALQRSGGGRRGQTIFRFPLRTKDMKE